MHAYGRFQNVDFLTVSAQKVSNRFLTASSSNRGLDRTFFNKIFYCQQKLNGNQYSNPSYEMVRLDVGKNASSLRKNEHKRD